MRNTVANQFPSSATEFPPGTSVLREYAPRNCAGLLALACLSISAAFAQTASFPANSKLVGLAANSAIALSGYAPAPLAGCDAYPTSITDYSRLNYDSSNHQILMFGGGHSATPRTDVDTFNLGTWQWQSAYPSTPLVDMTATNFNTDTGGWNSTGHPLNRHTYDMNVFAPNTGELIVLQRTGPNSKCEQVFDRFYAPGKIWHYNPRTATWRASTVAPLWRDTAPAAEYDPISGKIVVLDRYGLYTYDPVLKVAAQHLTFARGELAYAQNLVYFPPNDRHYYIENDGTVFEIALNRSDLTRSTVTQLTGITGPPPTGLMPNISGSDSGETGWAYDSVSRVIGGGVANGVFYAFDPVARSWTNRLIQVPAGSAPVSKLAFHSIDYVPSDNVFVFLDRSSSANAAPLLTTWAYRYGLAAPSASPMPISTFHVTDSTTLGATWLKVLSGSGEFAWRNAGGDWRDRNLVLQGTTPWASATISDIDREQVLNLDVTELVRRHRSSGADQLPNPGWILRLESGSALGSYYSREYPDAARRPKLKVITSGGTLTVEPGADAILASSAVTPAGNAATTMSVENKARIALWFDLTSISSGSVLSATLTLTSTATQYGGGTGLIGIYPIDIDPNALPASTTSVTRDLIAPSVPGGVVAAQISPTQINLSWPPSSDNVGVAGYRVYRDGAPVGDTAMTAFNNIGLTPGTNYQYAVSSFDQAGNFSGQSALIAAQTPALAPAPVAADGRPPVIPETALRISDSIYSGATWLKMMGGQINVPWIHAGGDWIDRNLALQGNAPWASATITDKDAEQVLSFDVTELVRRHRSALSDRIPNRGWILKTDSGTAIGIYYSRESADPAKRPVLKVQTSVATYNLSAQADAPISVSSQTPGGNAAATMSIETQNRIALWFDLSGIAGTLQSASLVMTTTATQYGGGTATLGLYPVDLSETFAPIAVRSGIGAQFPLDQGIETHPDVLFVERFRDLNMQNRGWWWAGSDMTIQGNRRIVGDRDPQDPNYRPLAPGVSAYKMTIPTGSYGGEFGRWSLWSNLGYEPEELYIRAHARMGTDFDSMAGKFPFGFDGTYIPRNYLALPDGSGYTQYLASNPASGRAWIRPDAPVYAGNGGETSNGRNGWSARGGFVASDCDSALCPGAAANPLIAAGYRTLHYYTYWADQPEAKGTPFDWRNGLLGIIPKNNWFVIDNYVKLNSVNADGSGNQDGILRTWINGRLAYEKTDFRVRNWPGNPAGARNIKLDSVWLNLYHGGLAAAISPMSVYLSNLVVSKSYVGPSTFVVP